MFRLLGCLQMRMLRPAPSCLRAWGAVRTVLAFNAADRAAEEYNEVRSTRNPCPNHLLVTGCAM